VNTFSPTPSGVASARSALCDAIFALASPMRSSVPSGQVVHVMCSVSVPLASTRASARRGAGLRHRKANAAAAAASRSPLTSAIVAEYCGRGVGGGGRLERRRDSSGIDW
jgi:hypothetical protein